MKLVSGASGDRVRLRSGWLALTDEFPERDMGGVGL